MSLLVLGLNHTTAPVDVRERVVFEPTDLQQALAELTALSGVYEAAIISTCNRTEIYCTLDSPDPEEHELLDWFHGWHALERDTIETCLYSHRDRDAIRHLLRVASGLDSMILGEPQIAGQLKDAWRTALAHGTVGPELGRLFQHAFAVAKEIRTETAIGASPVSVAFAAVTLARQIFGELGHRRALMIGAGETIELVARHLQSAGIGGLLVANRDPQRAVDVAATFEGRGIGLAQLPEVHCMSRTSSSRRRRAHCPFSARARWSRRSSAGGTGPCSWSTSPSRAISSPRSGASTTCSSTPSTICRA